MEFNHSAIFFVKMILIIRLHNFLNMQIKSFKTWIKKKFKNRQTWAVMIEIRTVVAWQGWGHIEDSKSWHRAKTDHIQRIKKHAGFGHPYSNAVPQNGMLSPRSQVNCFPSSNSTPSHSVRYKSRISLFSKKQDLSPVCMDGQLLGNVLCPNEELG